MSIQNNPSRRTRGERGLSLLEVGMALALSATVIAGVAWYASNAAQKMKRRSDAQYLLTLTRASTAYIERNQKTLLQGGSLDPHNHPGAVLQVQITGGTGGDSLVSDGDLPPNIQNVLSQQQQAKLLLRAIEQPPRSGNYAVQGLLTTYGGTPFKDDQSGQIVALMGAAGGMITPGISHSATQIDGANGGWRDDAANWANVPKEGHVMALVGLSNGVGNDDLGPWLAREKMDTAGPPYLHNTMQTDINMYDTFSNPGSPTHYKLLGADSVQANEYVGQTPGGDIHIGSLTATPNIEMGGAGTSNIALNTGGTQAQFKYDGSTAEADIGALAPAAGTDVTAVTNLTATGSMSGAASINVKADGFPATINLSTKNHNNVTSDAVNLSSTTLNLDAEPATGALFATPAINLNALDHNEYNDGNINLTAATGESWLGVWQGQSSLQLSGTGNPEPGTGFTSSIKLATNYYELDISDSNTNGGGSVIYDHRPFIYTSIFGATTHTPDTATVYLGCPGSGIPEPAQCHDGWHVDLAVTGNAYGSSDWHRMSDRRLKKDIVPLSNALNKIDQLNGYSFKWKKDGTPDIGVIAQEVEKIFPTVVAEHNGIKTVAYATLVAPLIEAVKTLHHMLNDAIATFSKQIAALQQDDHTLQTQVQTLTEQNAELKAEWAQQQFDLVKLKYAIHQPLTIEERTLCGAACAP